MIKYCSNLWQDLSKFHKFFFVIFAGLELLLFISPIFLGKAVIILSVASIVGLIASFAAILASIYQARREIYFYICFMVLTLAFAYLAYLNKYYGQIILNLAFLFPFQIYGIINWHKHQDVTGRFVKITKIPTNKIFQYSSIFLLGLVLYYILILETPFLLGLIQVSAPQDPRPFFDALVAMCYITAIYLTSKRYIEQWYFWILGDFLGILIFLYSLIFYLGFKFYIASISILIIYLRAIIGSAYGFYLWKKNLQHS